MITIKEGDPKVIFFIIPANGQKEEDASVLPRKYRVK